MPNTPLHRPPANAPTIIGLKEASKRTGLSIPILLRLVEQGLISAVRSGEYTLLRSDEVRAIAIPAEQLMQLARTQLSKSKTNSDTAARRPGENHVQQSTRTV